MILAVDGEEKPWCEKVRAGSNPRDHPSAWENWSTVTLPGLPNMLHHRIKATIQVLMTLRPVLSLTEHSEEVVPAVPYALLGSSLSFPFWWTSASGHVWLIPSLLWNLFWQPLGTITCPFLYVVSAAAIITGINTAVISLCWLLSFISLFLLRVSYLRTGVISHSCLSLHGLSNLAHGRFSITVRSCFNSHIQYLNRTS